MLARISLYVKGYEGSSADNKPSINNLWKQKIRNELWANYVITNVQKKDYMSNCITERIYNRNEKLHKFINRTIK